MKKHILALSLFLVFPTASVFADQHLPSSPDPGPYTITNNTAKTIVVDYGYVQKNRHVNHMALHIKPRDSRTLKFDKPLLPLLGIEVNIKDGSFTQVLQSTGEIYYVVFIKDDKATILCEDNKDFDVVECY